MIDELWVDGLQIGGDEANYRILTAGQGFFGGPVPRSNRPDRAQRDGSIDLTYFYGGRVIELTGIVVGDSIADALDKLDVLKYAFRLNTGVVNDYEQLGVNQGSPQHALKRKLVGRDYFEQCYFTQDAAFDAPLDVPNRIIPWGVTIVANDPRWYQIHEDDEDTEPYGENVVVEGGYLQVTLLSNDEDIIAGGNTPALPWITFQGPFNNYARVDLTQSGHPTESDRVNYSLGDGNNIDIVTRTRLAIKNQTIMHSLIDRENTDWFELPPYDTVEVQHFTGGGTDGGSTCRVRWQAARL